MNLSLQKANFWKRISAFLFDFILLGMIAVGLAAALSALFGYNSYTERMTELYERYEEEYGIDLDISEEEYMKLTDDKKQAYADANKAMNEDEETLYVYNMLFNLALIIISLSLLITYLVFEFAVPMFFGNGQTLGKKVFGIAVMRTNSVKLTGPVLFIRSVLGKFTMETMIPVLILMMVVFGDLGFVGTILLILILVLELITVASTKTRSAIHDLLSDTVVVDLASQYIFESEEALIEYKKQLHKEEVEKKNNY